MTIVVTGASGFIGRAVVAELAARGEATLAVSRQPVAFVAPARTLQVSEYENLEPPDADAVLVHLAEPRDIAQVETTRPNDASSRATFASLLAKGWRHVVYISSAAVYGDQSSRACRPEDAPNPRSRYASAKLAFEGDVLARGGAAARLANIYGTGMAVNNVLSDILANIPGEGPLAVRDTVPVRDYLWIEDAGRGIADIAMRRASGVLNFGTGRGVSVGELARIALVAGGEESRPVVATAPNGAFSSLVLDIARTSDVLGWRPSMTLEAGIATLVASRR